MGGHLRVEMGRIISMNEYLKYHNYYKRAVISCLAALYVWSRGLVTLVGCVNRLL
jgi:hypothetical protein